MAYELSSPSLTERQSDLTARLILDAAIATLEDESVKGLTVRAVAARANISERTVFRYFATRDDFLDGVALEVMRRLRTPDHPRTLEELLAAPAALYACFEAQHKLTVTTLHTEISQRIRANIAKGRWVAVRKLVDRLASRKPENERKIAAANIRFFLAASTWHYYRTTFGLSAAETVECAEVAIRQALAGLGVRLPKRAS
ncbi:MAG: TetR/AcrR family transcriptional regulator [Bacillota bacterium]